MKKLVVFVFILSYYKIHSQAVCFNQATFSPISNWAYLSDTADFNNDGVIDFVCVNGGFDLKLSNGWGNYLPTTNISYTANLYYRTGDFNGDNNYDVIGIGSNFAVTWFGNGAGTFSAPVQYAIPGPIEYLVADFNNDGNTDFATINSPGNYFSIHMSNGVGSYVPTGSYSTANSYANITTGDFNNDGNKDLAVIDGSLISVFRGIGNGTFSLTSSVPTAPVYTLTSKDINNDGKSDLITTSSSATLISVIKATNNFSFFPAQNYTVGSGIWWPRISFADFNSDSQIDIVSVGGVTTGVVLLNSGIGTFTSQTAFVIPTFGGPVWDVKAVKLNPDNKPDLAITIDNAWEMVLLLNCNLVNLVEDKIIPESVNIFPNPNYGSFKFQMDNEIKNGQLILINSIGQKVFSQNIIQGTNEVKTNELPIGLYNCILFQDNRQINSGRLLIE